MNEYDPVKDNTSVHDRSSHAGSEESSRERERRADADGREYTNPDGTHGYVYNARDGSFDPRSFNYRNAFITVLVLMIALTLIACCLVGAYFTSLSPDPDPKETGEGEDGTSDGMYIMDETVDQNGNELHPSVPGGNNDPQNYETAPALDSITKLPPERVDGDGDGRPDVVYGEDGQVITSAGSDVLTIATVFSRVADSVVEIITETAAVSAPSGQYVSGGAGSGVIVSREGYIVTNHHVIEGASRITVRLTDGSELSAVLVGTDEQTDIAVVRVDPGSRSLTVATLGASYDLVVGEDVIAIGNPLGSLGGTVTEGMISATARQIRVGGSLMTLLQTSAPVNPGNSGGGLFNMAGELIGIVNAKIATEDVEGLGFAVPVDTVYDVILELIHFGYVRGRPALDFTVVDVTSYQAAYYYFKSASIGVFVYDRSHDVLQYGDRIIYADGHTITTSSQLDAIIRDKQIGDSLELVVKRGRDELSVTVKVTEYIPVSVHSVD